MANRTGTSSTFQLNISRCNRAELQYNTWPVGAAVTHWLTSITKFLLLHLGDPFVIPEPSFCYKEKVNQREKNVFPNFVMVIIFLIQLGKEYL